MKRKCNNEGFTLIEVLVAMSIILLIAMSFFEILGISIKNNTKNEKDIKILNIATSEIENIREQIKDTEDEEIVLNNNQKISWINDESNEEYHTKVDNVECIVKIKIHREKKDNNLYLYSIDPIQVKLKDEYFSKRNIIISTKIFGR